VENEERAKMIKDVQKIVRFCPHCGYESDKPFDGVDWNGGDWDCESCKETVEGYVLSMSTDEDEDISVSESGNSGCIWGTLGIIVIAVVVALSMYFLN
jgi:ribosomal protein L37AE/L43A